MRSGWKNLVRTAAVGILASCFALPATAEMTTVDGETWYYVVSNGVATVTGGSVGTIPSSLDGYPVTEIGSAIFGVSFLKSISIPFGVTNIGNSAFNSLNGLTNISIPNSVQRIGNGAFGGCIRLPSLTIPNSVTCIGQGAFSSCWALQSVTIGNSVTNIGDSAFSHCSQLTSVTIPDSVMYIGDYAFSGCVGLDSLHVGGGNAKYASENGIVFNKNKTSLFLYPQGKAGGYRIPSSVTNIGDNAFLGCSRLESVEIPDSVIGIGNRAFEACTTLKSLATGAGVTSIGSSAFSNCGQLLDLAIGGAASIGDNAFHNCTNLSNVAMTGDVTRIGNQAFENCNKLTDVVMPDSVTDIGDSAFRDCDSLKNVAIGASVTNIGHSAFSFCVNLTQVAIPKNVTCIGGMAFSNCRNLMPVTIPDSVASIGESAFTGCPDALFDAGTMPGIALLDGWAIKGTNSLSGTLDLRGIRGIADSAFVGCSNLTSVTIGDGVQSVGSRAFARCTKLESIEVASGNRNHVSQEGVLFNKAKTRLLQYPAGKRNGAYDIPKSVTRIGDYAFADCRYLTQVTIPDSVTNIMDGSFSGCSELKRVTIGKGVMSITNTAFSGCPDTLFDTETIPGVKLLDGWVIKGAPSLSGNLELDAIRGIADAAFRGCSNLVRVTLGYGVMNIGSRAFHSCRNLEEVTIPDSVTRIGGRAFYECRGLTSLTLPESVWSVGEAAFSGCNNLKTLRVPKSWMGTEKLTQAGVPETCDVVYTTESEPSPPEEENPNLSITPLTRNFGTGGGAAAIVVSGSGTWNASASVDWITLNSTTGSAGYPVAYTVGATTNVEKRTGYVYVSGHVHTVTQDGFGGSIDPTAATFETEGGMGTISVTAPDRICWKAKSNCSWLNVSPVLGFGSGDVFFSVESLDEVNTRQGTLTVAGQTFSVFQYGRRMKLSPTTAVYDYFTHEIPITVDALAITEWSVEPQNSWISVVDGGNGKGSDLVKISIGENPSWAARTGAVKIGTETFTVTQKGRTALMFDVSPAATTTSVAGANGLIVVTATPDLPWSAKSEANWLTVYAATASGAGNGNVVYSAAPNSTLYERTGSIAVIPGNETLAVKYQTVTQPAASSALSAAGYEFEVAGESCEVRVTVADIVQWSIENTNEWLEVVGATSRVGAGTVMLQAAPNDSVYRKEGTVTIARKTFKVSQKARGVEVEYETKLFGTDGGSDSISIHPDGQVSWTAVASDKSWITIFGGASGTGDGEILYIVSPYVGNGEARTGTIRVGDKVVYITQRAYDLSIDPSGSVVAGNNGAGEFGVSAGIADVWRAIVTEPWITLVDGFDAGTGSGVVRFAYADNDTGKMRTGKIIVAGEVYTLTQKARELVAVSAEAGRGGSVEGAGTYDLGAEATLTAVPDSGYAFSYWTGDFESMENPLVFRVDIPKSVTAVFEPLPIAFESVVSGTDGVTLAWNNLAWATHYLLYRGVTSVPSSAEVLADIPNTGECSFLDDTGEVEVEYWYWIEAEGVEDDVMSDPMTGKKKWGWPAAKDEAEVAAALGEAADARLEEKIGSVEEYDAFRAWSAEEGREEKAVKESEHAWVSYAMGAEGLFENEPVVVLGVPAAAEEGGEKGSRGAGEVQWVVSVTVKDGEKAVAVDAEKVAGLFECTGDLGDWTGEAALVPTVVFKSAEGETLLFEVTPGDGTVPRAFLRIGE